MMKIKLVRKGWKTDNKNIYVVVKPATDLFTFWLNIRSAAYFAANELSDTPLKHDDILDPNCMLGTIGTKFDRRNLRLK